MSNFYTVLSLFSRTQLLIGKDSLKRLQDLKIVIFGIGGVGGWTAEALIRSGVKNLTLVDPDNVCQSNINRQLVATQKTIGRPKVDVMKERLLDINPEAEIVALNQKYSKETATDFDLNEYDYVVDAIDSVDDKVLLILNATQSSAQFVSSMGAARKMDPLKVSVAEFWKVKGCPLAAILRRKIKKGGIFPQKKFKCVYSEELLENKDVLESEERVNGSMIHITGVFGLILASLIIQ